MQTYSGSLLVAIAATFASVDIDPAERAGYVNEIVGVELQLDVASTAPGDCMFAASVKVPSRATFNETEQHAADIIAHGVCPNSVISRAPGPDTNVYVVLDEDAFFQDTLRLLFATRDGAGAAAAQTIFYRIFVEERKLTDSIRNTINRRAYS